MKKISLRIKEILNINKISSAPVDLEKVAKGFGVKIEYSKLENDISGFLYLKDKTPIIFVNKLHPITRQRFTIAHELGHLILNHQGDLFVDKGSILFRNTHSQNGIVKEEREANRFAAELLMPEEILLKEFIENEIDIENADQLNKLANKFEVSTQALTIRLTNLGWSFF